MGVGRDGGYEHWASSIVGNISLESVVDDSSHESSIAVIATPRDGSSHAGKEEP